MKKKSKPPINDSASMAYWTETKRKTMTDFLGAFWVHHRVWMQELADAFKARGRFGIHLFSLCDGYSDPMDKEVAAFASLLLTKNPETRLLQQHELRELIGEHPYRNFLMNRKFVELSMGNNQTMRMCKSFTQMYELASVLSCLYEIVNTYGSVGEGMKSGLKGRKNLDPYIVLSSLLMREHITMRQYKLNLLLMYMCQTDGIGCGVWDIDCSRLYCPEDRDMIEFMELWFPEFWQCGLTFDRAVNLLQLRNQTDFFYCCMGFNVLKMANTEETLRYVKHYQNKFNNRTLTRLLAMHRLEPKFVFE